MKYEVVNLNARAFKIKMSFIGEIGYFL